VVERSQQERQVNALGWQPFQIRAGKVVAPRNAVLQAGLAQLLYGCVQQVRGDVREVKSATTRARNSV
jgi:hypothetical protein